MTDRQHWENVYSRQSAQEVSWYQRSPDLSLTLIARSGVRREEPVIDVGGGASTLVDGLLARGYRDVSVLDIATSALAVAQARLGLRAAAVHWLEADITRFVPSRRYSLWHDRAVFHFLTQADSRRHYRKALLEAMAPGGRVIIAAFAMGGPTLCSGLPIEQYDAEKITQELGADFKPLETVQELHTTPAGDTQAFNYFHFRRSP